ncbi:MAG: nodulation protein NfeD [Chitinophagaceae bacterium]|nr:nodulation protein NfeD [Chitinophagaceae bacterium]
MQRLLFILLFYFLPTPFYGQKVVTITIDGSINPATTDYILRGIKHAEKESASALVINLNTPGGLLKSTRIITGTILDAPIPVIVYVTPNGAHAGSAGVFITLAAHIAAMAPGTNIGAAHPVSMQGGADSVMNTKTTNDAIAYITTIAQKRNRNVEWAQDAVRNSVSITSTEALALNVIDTIAPNLQILLQQIHGKRVEVGEGNFVLQTNGASVVHLDMSFAEKLLNIISDPNIAYILMLLGFYGLLFEIYNPGAVFPGIIGAISIILAFYAMNTLPVNYAGVALIVLAIILFILEIKIVSHGLLAIGGVIALFIGSIMLIKEDNFTGLMTISKSVIITSTIITTLFFLFVIGMGLKAQKGKQVTGMAGLIGQTGEALEDLENSGYIMVMGERWQAESISGKIEKGQNVRVTSFKDFKLFVEIV